MLLQKNRVPFKGLHYSNTAAFPDGSITHGLTSLFFLVHIQQLQQVAHYGL